jgi:hypothetical protein
VVYGKEKRPVPTISAYLFPMFVISGEFSCLFFEKVVVLTGRNVNKNNPIIKREIVILR